LLPATYAEAALRPLLIRFYPSGKEQQEARTHERSLMQIAGFDFPCHQLSLRRIRGSIWAKYSSASF
jgi:hypothetical protein